MALVQARATGGARKRRSTTPNKELSATLKLNDADPVSDFSIAKIVFKERYGEEEETHTIDFERKAFIQDDTESGSKLTAEFRVGDDIVAAKEEEKIQITTYNIVLRPRGN